MKWQRIKGVTPETWHLRGLRIKRTPKGFLLYEAQMGLPGIAPKVKPQPFQELKDAKSWGKRLLELG